MRVVIVNFSRLRQRRRRPFARSPWPEKPEPPAERRTLFAYGVGWGFHIMAMGIRLRDLGVADEVEFWSDGPERGFRWTPEGVLWVSMADTRDVHSYLRAFGAPDLVINYGSVGHAVLSALAGKSFRVHVPCLRTRAPRPDNFNAECYLVDDACFLDDRSMLYVPVVNTDCIRPLDVPKERDFIYLANAREGKRHDILLAAVRGTALSGHLHPVNEGELDLAGLPITTSAWGAADLPALLSSSRMAVSTGDYTSNPAAIWECVAAGLPIVVNEKMVGGRHVVVPGVTGEMASEASFGQAMQRVLAERERYRPHAYFAEHWDTLSQLQRYFDFFHALGWEVNVCS